VVHWVLGRPAPGDRQLIESAIAHGLASFGELTGGAMDKATQQINTPVK